MIGSTAKNQQQDMDTAAQKYQKYLREYNIHRNQCINIIRKALQDIRDDLKQREQKRKLKRSSVTPNRNRRPGTKYTGNATNHEKHNITSIRQCTRQPTIFRGSTTLVRPGQTGSVLCCGYSGGAVSKPQTNPTT